jgi:hypothetical protein
MLPRHARRWRSWSATAAALAADGLELFVDDLRGATPGPPPLAAASLQRIRLS